MRRPCLQDAKVFDAVLWSSYGAVAVVCGRSRQFCHPEVRTNPSQNIGNTCSLDLKLWLHRSVDA